MGLVPGMGKDNERPPNMSAHLWFIRSLVGLAFTLWSVALANPLLKFNNWSVPVQTNQIYPLQVGRAPPACSVFVDATIVAIVAVGIASGAAAIDNEDVRKLASFLISAAGFWCAIGGLLSADYVFGSHKGWHATPLTGVWLIWGAMGVLGIANFVFRSIPDISKTPDSAPT